MNTYVLLAPYCVQVDDWNSDCRYFHAPDLPHARETAGEIWRCDPDDIMCLIAFKGECTALGLPGKKVTPAPAMMP